MHEHILTARRMVRVALLTHDPLMWAAAHNLARGCLQ